MRRIKLVLQKFRSARGSVPALLTYILRIVSLLQVSVRRQEIPKPISLRKRIPGLESYQNLILVNQFAIL